MKHTNIIFLLTFLLLGSISLKGQQNDGPLYARLDNRLQIDFKDKFGFTVLIADDQKILFSKSYGYIDTLKTQPVNKETLFNIASISKSFTAIGILRLVEQNKIKLTDTIGRFINKVPTDKTSITIDHLLSHKSGFQQNYVCDGLKQSNEALNALLLDTLSFSPGSDFSYSNQNFAMLALIIEKVTSLTYEDFIRNEILKPLKLKKTHFWNEITNCKNIAGKNQIFPGSLMGRNWGYIGSNGIYSTPSELYKFMNAVINNQIISKENEELLFKEYHRTNSGLSIGYGWFVSDSTEWKTQEIWTRGSESWGHNAVIRWFPQKERMIIVCTNSGEYGNQQTTGNRMISNYVVNFLLK